MNLIVTTTDSIEGAKITQYIDVLRCSMVVGTDLALTDLLSGANNKYRYQLNKIYDKGMRDLRQKGTSVGADAIVGLHTDFEEIFGKGKTKFVVSMVGTAVKLDCPRKAVPVDKYDSVPFTEVRRRQLFITLNNKLADDKYALNEDDWNDIINYSLFDLAPQIYRRYLLLAKETISSTPLAGKKLLLENFIPFMNSLDFEDAAEVVYSDFVTEPYATSEIVKACNLFHPGKIVDMLKHDNKHIVISLLGADKPTYDNTDLQQMRKIEDFLDNLPDTGHYEEGRGSLFSKTGTLLVCERGHTSAVELGGHCTETLERGLGICNLNVKGITEAEVNEIKLFKQKIAVLVSLLKSDKPE